MRNDFGDWECVMEKYFMAALGGAEGLGNKSIALLVKFFGSAQSAWSAEVADLFKSSVRKISLEAFIKFRQAHPDAPEKLANYCARQKISLCSISDDDYPPLLKEIDSPPMFFYYRGKLEPHAQRVGIVGSRHNTAYGQNVALELAEKLAAAGLTVVSGAARGIDTFAHTGALETGRTVAVLGQGLAVPFHREKKKLLERIIENGLIMSEFSLKTPANEGTFIARNRIISGLCRGVVVVEAGKKSGALVTGDFASKQGRDVFALPGSIYWKKSVGCHDLIFDGALLIRNAQDVLEHYHWYVPKKISAPPEKSNASEKSADVLEKVPAKKSADVPKNVPEKISVPPPNLSDRAAKIFELIPAGDFITGDEILNVTDEIAPHELPKIILELEIKNCVVEDAGRYTRKSN